MSGAAGVQMRRREFLAAVTGAPACTPRSRAAQRPDPVIGYLYAGSLATNPPSVAAFRSGLAEAGYVEGRNIRMEYRDAVNEPSRLPGLALDLVSRDVSVIAAGSGPSAIAAKAATAATPIVFAMAGDPIRVGRILDGANPADLPVRRLAKFELVINMSAAAALGLTVPARLLALTDQVI